MVDLHHTTSHHRCGFPESNRDLSRVATSLPMAWYNVPATLRDYPRPDTVSAAYEDASDDDNDNHYFLRME